MKQSLFDHITVRYDLCSFWPFPTA
jgi:hypothetical protein